MYACSFSTCRIAKNFPSSQVSYVSKFTYRALMNDSTKITTTTVVQRNFNRTESHKSAKRSISADSLKSIGSKQLNLHVQNVVAQSKEILRTVKLSDLSAAPQPAFWYGVTGLIPFAFAPLSSMIFGFSPFLASAQLLYGATICSFLGGVKWGNAMVDKSGQEPSWENLGYAVAPQLISWVGLLLPQTLGFLFVSGALLSAAYIDLTSSYYKPWFKALRLSLTVPAVFFLLLMWFFNLFH